MALNGVFNESSRFLPRRVETPPQVVLVIAMESEGFPTGQPQPEEAPQPAAGHEQQPVDPGVAPETPPPAASASPFAGILASLAAMAPAAPTTPPPAPLAPSPVADAPDPWPEAAAAPAPAPEPPPFSFRLTPVEMDALRAKIMVGGALTAVLEAIEEALFIFSASGQLVHANAHALKTVDQVGVQGAVGLRLSEFFGCPVDEIAPAGCGTASPCRNCEAIRTMLGALEGAAVEKPVALHLEQIAGSFLGKFEVKAAPIDVDGIRLHLLILRQRSLVKRNDRAKR